MKKKNYRRFMKGIGCLTALTMMAGMISGCSGSPKTENKETTQGSTAASAAEDKKGSEVAPEWDY